jgi:hypothetical protein
MKLPRLKHYYLALNESDYAEFAHSREIAVTPVTIDPVTGEIRGRPSLTLYSQGRLADQAVRDHYQHQGSVWVLRIPAHCVPRAQLQRLASEVYTVNCSLTVPHCGVERWDLGPA